MCLDVTQPGGKVSLRWLIYSAAMEGAQYGMSLTFKPPRHDDQPHLIYFRYGRAEVDSSLAQRDEVRSDQSPTTGREGLHYWFRMQFATPTSLALCPTAPLALCPTATMLMRLQFQSALLQTPGWAESPKWQHRRPLRITQYWLKVDGLPDPYENGVDFFELAQRHQRPQFHMVKMSIGPMTPRVLCGDDLSGEI